jgi:DNA-binding transcriptional ArsR family regulator
MARELAGDPGPVFAALADPTRRAVFRALTDTGSATATELAGDLPVSRQAVVKHLQALAEAGLVAHERHGREQRYRPTPAPLGDALAWMVDAGARWDDRLRRLDARIGRQRRSS